jgi:hypothetical protein
MKLSILSIILATYLAAPAFASVSVKFHVCHHRELAF